MRRPHFGRALGVALVAGLAVVPWVTRGLGLAFAESPLARAALPLALVCGGLLAAAIGVPLYLQLMKRMRRLIRVTHALAQEDFDAPLPPPADDELGELQRAYKRMRLAMEDRILALRGEVGRQRSILDGMAEGVALLQDGEIVAANPAFGQLIGAGGALEGKTVLQAARIPELAEVIDESVRAEGEVVRELVADPRTLRVAARPLGGPQRETVVVLLDMTEARRLERLRRDFVANASHELRTPVAAIVGAADTLADGAIDDAEARGSFVDILQRHAHRLSELTADLLDLARLEAGYRPRAEIVDVASVVDRVVVALRARAEAKQIGLSSHLSSPALQLAAERAAVEQVLTNLVDNAVKYTPPGGSVRIAVRSGVRLREVAALELTVSDTGPGIAADHLPRLFERFYRVDNARSRELGGTGLGLSIVKHLVAANGGEIHVASEVGRGTTFTVVLPCPRIDSKSSQESHGAPRQDG